ncbi:MAG TPA: hypothetical protein VFT06_13840, partial [Flavisolibacter sp.]|nr:hypothetical protein [Flavisolibacter sp.]
MLQTSVCANYYNRFTVTGSSTGTGLTYQRERSFDNVSWAAISYYNTEEMVISQSATTWYRRKIRCGGDSAVSSTVLVTQKAATDCYCIPGTTVCTNFSITNVVYSSLNNT